MFEIRSRIEARERAILVGVEWEDAAFAKPDAGASLAELAALAQTAGVDVVCEALHQQGAPTPATLIGSGKAEELRRLNEELRAEVFLFDDELTPAQMRNLERLFDAKVIDRTDLILDIFAQRARTKEAKLQVELAQLETALPRLTRHWTHLSRLGGGSSVSGGVGTRGPGETQLQMDRRWIRGRITHLRQELRAVVRHREVQRKGRADLYSAALVGYTNAGKSSLLNALTGTEHVHVENKLFATLDPTTRALPLPEGRMLALTDTVGFIQRLPHRLVAAFRATLEEVLEADLLIHVVDVSHPGALDQIAAVGQVLTELGGASIPTQMVLNKADLLPDGDDAIANCRERFSEAIAVSARTGVGLDVLRMALSRRVAARETEYFFRLSHRDGGLLSYLYRHGSVETVDYQEAAILVRASLDPKYVAPLQAFVVPTPSGT